jgi:drug/metabolite transporter (DMT)-like permease
MNDTKQLSVLKFALSAVAAVIALNILMRFVFKLNGGPLNVAIGAGVAGLIAYWFSQAVGRAPTPQERSRFLWLYGGILAFLFLSVTLLASLSKTPTVPGLFIVLIYYLPYPAFAAMFFSEKHFARLLPK